MQKRLGNRNIPISPAGTGMLVHFSICFSLEEGYLLVPRGSLNPATYLCRNAGASSLLLFRYNYKQILIIFLHHILLTGELLK